MKLTINNTTIESTASTLQELAEQQNLPAKGIAIAVDNKLVPRTEWSSFMLVEGQKITIVKAFCGG